MPHRRMPRLLAWSLAAASLVAVLVVAVPYLYTNVIEGDAPAELSANRDTTAGAPQIPPEAAAPAEGVWTVGAGSQAGYRVAEVLGGQQTTAVGRTDAVTGSVTVTGTRVTAGSFSVDLTQVSSDQSRRDAQFRGRIMDTVRYPAATFTLTSPVDLGNLATSTGTTTMDATGTLLLHGVTRTVTAAVTVVRSASGVKISGQVPVVFADYGIDNPSIGDFVKTGDDGVIEVLLTLSKST